MAKDFCRTLWGVLIIFMASGVYEAISMEKGEHEDLKEELFSAVKAHDKQAVINAFDKGASEYINQIDMDKTPLMFAIKEDDPEMVDLLLDKGADTKIVNRHGQSAIFYALSKYAPNENETPKPLKHAARIVDALITHGADVNKQNSTGNVPLMNALILEDPTLKYTIVSDLIKHGARNIANTRNMTPFKFEMMRVNMEQQPDLRVLRLLAKIASMEQVKMLFDEAIQKQKVPMARFLMEQKGIPIDELDQHDKTRLISYIEQHKLDIVNILIQLGANVNQADTHGNMPLHYAVRADDTSIMNFLLSRGALVNIHNEQGYTPLYKAVLEGNDYAVKDLLQVPTIRPDETDHHGLTPLHLAARENKYGIVVTLLGGNVSVDARDDDGNTPLILAVINGASLNVCLELVKKGANIKDQNNAGESAYSLRNNAQVNPDVRLWLERGLPGES